MAKKIIIVAGIVLVIFNPLSVNLWADFLVTGINFVAKNLIDISNYTMVAGFTLLGVGLVLAYSEYNSRQIKASKAKFKKAKSKKNTTDGMKYELDS